MQRPVARAPRRRDVRLTAAKVLERREDLQGALLQLDALASAEGADPHVSTLIQRLKRLAR